MRKNKLTKTSKPNIYETVTLDGSKNYIVRFSYLGKNYGQRNFTKLFGTRTLKQTFDKFQEVKVNISSGNNPFLKKVSITLDSYFEEHNKHNKDHHQYSTRKYYEKHIKPIIGNMDIDDIKKNHIEKILNGSLKNNKERSKLTLKEILRPIFNKGIKANLIKHSPLDDIKFNKAKGKRDLSFRLVDDFKTVAQQLYNEIQNIENIEDRCSVLICLMTARRRGEVTQLQRSDIKGDKVFVPESVTKTGTTDEYPLPDEVIELISTLPKGHDDIFTIGDHRMTSTFNKVVKDAKIQLTKDSKLTLHDTRNLFSSIMIPETNNPPLVDRCLSHAQHSIMNIYLDFTYDKRKDVFEKYWKILRGEI